MGYKEDIQIDINALDVELVRQAPLYQRWGKREAEALYKKDQVEESLSKCKAKLDLDIRANPQEFGFEGSGKPTESAINSMLILQPKVEEATELALKSRYKAKVLGIATKSFEHKKKALEKLTELYTSGYWATPRADKDAQKAFDEQAEEIVRKTTKFDERMLGLAKKKEENRLAEVEAEQANKAREKDEAKKKADKKRDEVKAISEAQAKAKAASKAKSKTKTKPKSEPIGKTKEQLEKPKNKGRKARPTRKKK